jgi:hypothetical protein
MCKLLTFSIWICFDENIQNMKVVYMSACKEGTNGFWPQLQRGKKKKREREREREFPVIGVHSSRGASTASFAKFSALAFHQMSRSVATLSLVATNP